MSATAALATPSTVSCPVQQVSPDVASLQFELIVVVPPGLGVDHPAAITYQRGSPAASTNCSLPMVRHGKRPTAGKVQEEHIATLQRRAEQHLPAVLAQLVGSTPDPFIQVIYDLRTPAMSQGPVAILGDSACIVRPHTAAGTSKASGDAVSLAQHLQAANFDLSHALALWQTERLAVAQRLHVWPRSLSRRFGLPAQVPLRQRFLARPWFGPYPSPGKSWQRLK